MIRKHFYRIKGKIFKQIFILQDYFNLVTGVVMNALGFIFGITALAYFVLLAIHLGFKEEGDVSAEIYVYYHAFLYVIFVAKFLPQIVRFKKRKLVRWITDVILFLLSFAVVISHYFENAAFAANLHVFHGFFILNLTVVLLIITELHRFMYLISSVKIVPSLLFVLSFLVVIFIGSGLLMLPNAQAEPVSYLNSLFTSVSAVCVTGLVVVDTATAFTPFGKVIIMCLIQVGGLGIMAFTGFFGYLFTGSASFKDRILLREMISSENLGGLFRVLTKIMLITFLVEITGALFIYFSLGDIGEDKLFFAVFHSVSAFCNAGFSTLSNGLSSAVLNNNVTINMVIAVLIILGGIGFPVLLTFYSVSKNTVIKFLFPSRWKKLAWHSITNNISSRIVVVTTMVLLVAGTVSYYLLENGKSLDGLNNLDKWIVAFFGSVSARTAGFNMVDISAWSYPTIFLMIFLMWVGASPGSTGGGIKTTTFAIALRMSYDFIRGRHVVEIGNREIGFETISRVLVVIMLSLMVISIGFFGLLISDADKNPVHLLFESFSAFGTVGLSIANSATFSATGKGILICLMFIGRLGPLTLLIGLFIPHRKQYFKYPKQNLVIN